MGFRPIVVDSRDHKRDMCLEMGAEAFMGFRKVKDVASEVIKIADGVGVHGVFVTATKAYSSAINLIGNRIGGKVMRIGLPPAGTVTIGADPFYSAARNLEIKGAMVGSMNDTNKA